MLKTMSINSLIVNQTSKTKQGIAKNHWSTIVKYKVNPKSPNIQKSVTFSKCVPGPLPTFWTQSNLLLVKVLRIAHVEILMQSTTAFHSISDRRCFRLCSSSVFGKVWAWVSSHHSPHRQPGQTRFPGWHQASGDPSLYLCLVKILLHCQHLTPDNNSGARHSHHRPQVTSIDFKYNAAFISTPFRKQCGWVTLTIYIIWVIQEKEHTRGNTCTNAMLLYTNS